MMPTEIESLPPRTAHGLTSRLGRELVNPKRLMRAGWPWWQIAWGLPGRQSDVGKPRQRTRSLHHGKSAVRCRQRSAGRSCRPTRRSMSYTEQTSTPGRSCRTFGPAVRFLKNLSSILAGSTYHIDQTHRSGRMSFGSSGQVSGVRFPSHLRSFGATMSQKSTFPQAARPVSQMLRSDSSMPMVRITNVRLLRLQRVRRPSYHARLEMLPDRIVNRAQV
jgi:hypothetical protein